MARENPKRDATVIDSEVPVIDRVLLEQRIRSTDRSALVSRIHSHPVAVAVGLSSGQRCLNRGMNPPS